MGAMPCTDAFHSHETEKAAVINSPEHHQDFKEDVCTPLCSCSCCGINVFNAGSNALSIQILHKEINKYSADYISHLSSTDFSSIWQPPKLG